jgi:hypothetical protein
MQRTSILSVCLGRPGRLRVVLAGLLAATSACKEGRYECRAGDVRVFQPDGGILSGSSSESAPLARLGVAPGALRLVVSGDAVTIEGESVDIFWTVHGVVFADGRFVQANGSQLDFRPSFASRPRRGEHIVVSYPSRRCTERRGTICSEWVEAVRVESEFLCSSYPLVTP